MARINLMITLGVNDIKRSAKFYETMFKLDRMPFDSDDIVFFDLGGAKLALFPREALAKDIGISAKGEGFSGTTLAHNVGSSLDVNSTIQHACDAGGKLVKPGQPVFWGGYSGYFADPDDHIWEIACSLDDYTKEKKDQETKVN